MIYRLANLVQKATLRLFADWEVTGLQNVPRDGPLIIVSNHVSNFDSSLLSRSLPRRLRFLAKATMFERMFLARWFLLRYGAFPLKREGVDVRAHRWVMGQLDAGNAIANFPEGTRNSEGMERAHSGVARLAMRTQAPVLPVGITGTERLGTFLRVLNPTGKITVNIGQPFTLPAIDGKPEKAELVSMTDMIMTRVAALLPPRYQGVYGVEGTGWRVKGVGSETLTPNP